MTLFSPHLRTLLPAFCIAVASWTLIGCGNVVVPSTPDAPTPPAPPAGAIPGLAFSGKVLAGTQPVVASSVQVWAAGTGSTATTVLSDAVTTDLTGAFSIPATYFCPASTSQLYVIARGGKVGAGSPNSAIALMTAIGTCGNLAAGSSFTISEATTVVTAWSLAQFLSDGAALASSSTNSTGIANAVATVASLVNLSTGAVPGAGFPSNGVAPTARINTLANLLNTCTAATTADPCTKLFSFTPGTSSTPTDTIDVAINIVHRPALNVAALYTLAANSSAFPTVLKAAPADWTLFVNFTGGGITQTTTTGIVANLPTGVAVDSTGSVWVATYFNAAAKFSPIGAAVFPNGITGTGLNASYAIAIDAKDNAWITNEIGPGYGNSVTVLNSAGQSISGASGFTSGGLDYPLAIAIDSTAATPTTWLVDYGNSHVTQLNSSGQPLSGASGYNSSDVAFPDAIVIDASHNAWIGDQNGTTVVKLSPDGSQSTAYSCCDSAQGMAIDQSNNLWIANYYGNSVSEISTTSGAVISNGGYTANGTINHPQGIAIDGSGNVWVANYRNTYLTQLAGSTATSPGQPLSPNPGWAPDSDLLEAFALAIDAGGNIWVTNFGSSTLTEFIGLASPVKTPLGLIPQAP